MRLIFIALLLWTLPARADRAGEFDYYVLALSWSPTWCAIEGDARGSDQCDARHDHGFILHGLWPQYERGWPDFCQTAERPPSRRMTRDMQDIMGSSGLAWHQWKKHGSCSGLSATNYYRLSREAYRRINRPALLRKVSKPLRLPAHVIEEAFLKDNPGLSPRGVTVTCRDRRISEVRICLTRSLEPRDCGPDVRQDCSLDDAIFAPIR
ncbi:MAG: ribonuclease T2 [Pseudomonadota bacterium]